jgi:secreted protein with Ig-like and vWFA domain
MGNRGVFQANTNHLRPGNFAAFADGIGNFAGFAEADTNTATLVADDNESAEIEAAAAFDDFGGAVDEDDLFDEFMAGLGIE